MVKPSLEMPFPVTWYSDKLKIWLIIKKKLNMFNLKLQRSLINKLWVSERP